MLRILAILGRGLLATIVISLLASAAGLGWLRLQGERLLAVESDSMRPVFSRGDAVLVAHDAPKLRVGQVVSFRDPLQAGVIVSHRIIGHSKGNWLVAGDAQPNSQQVVTTDQIVGRVVGVLPGVGRLLDAFHRPVGLLLLIYLPASALVMSELLRLRRRLSPPVYRAIPSR